MIKIEDIRIKYGEARTLNFKLKIGDPRNFTFSLRIKTSFGNSESIIEKDDDNFDKVTRYEERIATVLLTITDTKIIPGVYILQGQAVLVDSDSPISNQIRLIVEESNYMD